MSKTTHKKSFIDALRESVLVFDGAIGTELYRHHIFTNRCFEELCLSQPELLEKIHGDYCAAGADILTTNTFGANGEHLTKFGISEQLDEINRTGARLAREVADAADRPVYVAGSIGPVLKSDECETPPHEQLTAQIKALIEGGADVILFETQPTRDSLEDCATAMIPFGDFPFILSITIFENGESASGESLERVFAPMPDPCPQPTAWGMNCGTGPDGLLNVVQRAVGLTSIPLVVQPNAGVPKEIDNRRIYYCSPEYLSTYARRFVDLGASAVGGCCGTTPEHIREIADVIKPLARAAVAPVLSDIVAEAQPQEPTPLADKSRFAGRLARGQWVTSVELVPPRGYDLGGILEKSKTLYRQGVDAINIPDGPRASSRISPLITAQRIQQEAQIEAILHFCSRDRNLIGMQADMLACAACELRNILFVTGDPPKLGNYPRATGVFDTDSIGMAQLQSRLNQGIELGGQELRPKTQAVIGVGLDPTALDQDREIERFRQKCEAGAEFAITQPVFDPDSLLRMLDIVQAECPIPIIAGIWPLASYRNAMFMQNEVPGVEVPDSVMQRMAAANSREDQLKVGVTIARESVERIRDRIAGIQVSAPFGNIDTALAVLVD